MAAPRGAADGPETIGGTDVEMEEAVDLTLPSQEGPPPGEEAAEAGRRAPSEKREGGVTWGRRDDVP